MELNKTYIKVRTWDTNKAQEYKPAAMKSNPNEKSPPEESNLTKLIS